MTTVPINIIVYRATPLNFPEYRHTALTLHFTDRTPPLLVHIVGTPEAFRFQHRQIFSLPQNSPLCAKMIPVGPWMIDAPSAQVVAVLRRVGIDNVNPWFNCQMWMESALGMLRNTGYISGEAHDRAVNDMWEAVFREDDGEQ